MYQGIAFCSDNCASAINVTDFDDVCRCCLSYDAEMTPIFPSEPSKHLDQRITFCSGLEVTENDQKPKHICDRCLEGLIIACEFKTNYLRADTTLQQILRTGIKTEAIEERKEKLSDKDDYFRDQNLVKDEFKVEIEIEKVEVTKPQTAKTRLVMTRKEKDKRGTAIAKRGIRKKFALKTHKSEKVKAVVKVNLVCEECNLNFVTKQEYVKHMRKHKGRTWVCEICGRVYRHQSSYCTHVRTHGPPQYACAHCEYRAYEKSYLGKHMRMHTGTKDYKCEYCTAAYSISSNLYKHIRAVHEKIRLHQCTLCPKNYAYQAELKRHIDWHNGIKRFKCEVCCTMFTRRKHWKKHLYKQHAIDIPKERPGRRVREPSLVADDVTELAGDTQMKQNFKQER